MNAVASFYWHDYETFGANPALDRPVQFAGLRTDANLDEVGEPLVVYCQPTPDCLPHPDACLITGITPQIALAKGIPEYQFIERVHAELATPGTCGVGYNSIRFDDEVTRYTLYRNFYDPYAREWQNQNSRWDLIDVMRMARALRPEGFEWPDYESGTPSFRLEDLSRANGIEHTNAHDALADVRATVALARKLREKQRRLFDWALKARDKRWVSQQLNLIDAKPMLHFSSKFGPEHGKAGVVVPLAISQTNQNAVICCNLLEDPSALAALSADELREVLFMRRDQRRDTTPVVPLKQVMVNKSPMLAPVSMLEGGVAGRLRIDVNLVKERYQQVMAINGLQDKLKSLFAFEGVGPADVDSALYGGFLRDRDRALCEAVRAARPDELARLAGQFTDPRLPELLFRYRARHFPETLSADERATWCEYIAMKMHMGAFNLAAYRARIQTLREERAADADAQSILSDLDDYGQQLERAFAA